MQLSTQTILVSMPVMNPREIFGNHLTLLVHVVLTRITMDGTIVVFLNRFESIEKTYFCFHKISSMVLHIGRLNLHTSSTVVVVKAAAASTES